MQKKTGFFFHFLEHLYITLLLILFSRQSNFLFSFKIQLSQYLIHLHLFLINFFKRNLFIYFWLRWVFLAERRLSLVAASRDYSSVVVRRLLIAVASLVAEHGLYAHGLQ